MNNKIPKIVFMGTPSFADTALRRLLDSGYCVTLVVTAPDRPSGRGGKITESIVATTAREARINIAKPATKKELVKTLSEIKYDIVVVAAYGMIIPMDALDSASLGAYNIHASILPKYRGASPISTAILNGDVETGITIMKISAGMDEGDIIATVKTPITDKDTTATMTEKLAAMGSDLLIATLPNIIDQSITPVAQDDEVATYCSMIKKSDGEINFSQNAEEIERMIRAYNPWPGAYTYLNKKIIKILEAKVANSNEKIESGRFINKNSDLLLGTNRGALSILKIQPEGKKPMTPRDFINGNYIK